MTDWREQLARALAQAKGAGETALTFGTGAVAEPIAGLRGLLALAEGQPLAESVRKIEQTRGKLTYQGGRESQQQLRAIGNALLPAINAIEGAKNGMGNATLRATGSPGLATAAHIAPDAILAALGARPAMAGGNAAMRSLAPAVKRVAQRSAGPTMGSAQSQIGAIRAWEPLDQEVWDDGTIIEWGKTPFDALDSKVELPRGDDIRNAVEQTISLEGLRSTQPRVTRAGVYGQRNDSHGLPVVVESNGVRYIQDGHHRLSRELFDGNKEARVRFIRKN